MPPIELPTELLDPFELRAIVVIPIRSFAMGKQRLGTTLDDGARRGLAESLAQTVLNACRRLSALVVSSDPDVREWAAARFAFAIDDPGTLNGAAAAGRAWALAHDMARVVIAHADLPFADDFERVLAPNVDAVIVPDRHNDGNPIFALPSAGPFTFAYGPGSFTAHHSSACALGWNTMILRDHALGFDIDEPDDLKLSQYNISPDR